MQAGIPKYPPPQHHRNLSLIQGNFLRVRND